MQETQEMRVWSLGQKDSLEEEMATYSSILDWRIPWAEELGGLQSVGSQGVGHDWVINTFTFFQDCAYAEQGSVNTCQTWKTKPRARTLEWVAISSSRRPSWPRDRTRASCLLHWQLGSLLVPSGKPHFTYSGVYVLIPNSYFIPPLFFPLVIISLFSGSVNLFLFCK